MKSELPNDKVHSVESQWHYPILTKYGFVPQTKEAPGMVRRYDYVHPTGRKISCTTGMNADYWEDPEIKWSGHLGGVGSAKTHLWSDLEPHLKSLNLPMATRISEAGNG